ncbi:serine hydrolase domain-containing protein [Flavihumibacter fluvii]|uniref:serine hydrolase domain-containing protein n=1 Tax=Flavihumibacter fluvii TaxID=2838157 RepID=UPI001BDEE713|nr:serine hydrolase domain-containing protein [Flavihumibacter fluvii]ULQ53184.1 beta-lactamase family protein [Flavihumibacter fluvii]
MNSIHAFLQHEVMNNKTPSIQYAFFDADSTIYSFQYGLRDIKESKMVDATTTYNVFSITKTFTAIAVLQLAQAGLVELKAPMQKHLPWFPYGDTITVEQVLQHTAGIPNPLPLRWSHLAAEHAQFNRDLFFAQVFEKHDRLKSAPGKKFSYSNLGYVLLGQLIEHISGKTFEAFIKENILDKARIPRSDLDFVIDPAVHAKGYQKYWSFTNALLGVLINKQKFMDAREGKWKPFRNFYVNGTPYGGLIGSAKGLTRYAQVLLDNKNLLLDETHLKMLFTESKIAGQPTGMSLSWFTGSLKGNLYYAHAGGGGGYYVELRVYPELGVGSVVLNNRSGMRDERMLDKTDVYFLQYIPGRI